MMKKFQIFRWFGPKGVSIPYALTVANRLGDILNAARNEPESFSSYEQEGVAMARSDLAQITTELTQAQKEKPPITLSELIRRSWSVKKREDLAQALGCLANLSRICARYGGPENVIQGVGYDESGAIRQVLVGTTRVTGLCTMPTFVLQEWRHGNGIWIYGKPHSDKS